MEPRFRRGQPRLPFAGRGLPGMPLEEVDTDVEEAEGSGQHRARFSPLGGSLWKSRGKLGRALVLCVALIIFGGVALAAHVGKIYLERDARFRITGTDDIHATGLREVTRADLLPIFGEDIGRSAFFVPLALRQKQIEQLSWVEHATVERLLPNQIRVNVVERQPVAFVRKGQQIGLVDANGVLLDMSATKMASEHYSFPVLTGIDGRDSREARKSRIDLYMRLRQDLDADGQHNMDQISEIDLTDPENAKVWIPEQGADIVADFGETHFLERFQRFKSNIDAWRKQYPHLSEVDLRYERQVVLEMAPAAANATIAPTADAKVKAHSAAPVKEKAHISHPTRARAAHKSAKSLTRHHSTHRVRAASHHDRKISHTHRRTETHHKTTRRTHRSEAHRAHSYTRPRQG